MGEVVPNREGSGTLRDGFRDLRRPWILIVLCLYGLLLGAAVWRHTFWRDEAAVWLLDLDNGLRRLFHATRYEGHPPLWFLAVRPFTDLSRNPEWLKLPNTLATLAAASVVLSVRGLAVPVRLALVFSYFFLFEYGLIDRSYMMSAAFLLAATLWARRPDADLLFSLLLSVAALTTDNALVLACCLYGYRLVELPSARRGRRAWLAMGIFAVSVVAVALFVYPPPDSGSVLLREHSTAMHRLHLALNSIPDAYLPVPGRAVHFWNVTVFDRLPGRWEALLGCVLAVALGFFFRDRNTRRFFAVATLATLAFGAFSGRLAMRHVGWLFVAFVVTLILAGTQGERWTGWRRAFLGIVLAVQAASGVYAAAVSLWHPFSASLATAQFLRAQHLDAAPLVMAPAVAGQAVLAYLERPSAFYPEYRGQGSYVVWDKWLLLSPHLPTAEQMATLSRGTEPVVLITETTLPPAQAQELNVTEVASFDDAIAYDFGYIVYVRPAPGQAGR